MEARAAFSAVCRSCGLYWRVQEMLKPAAKTAALAPEQRHITCFDCKAELDVATTAQSTMCKKCSSYIDLHDYSINSAVSKNFKTKGSFVIQPTGYVFNSETVAADAVIKGRFIGKLTAERLTIYSTAQIKGSFSAGCLVIPAGNQFRWAGEIRVGAAEIEGELTAELVVDTSIHVGGSGRLFGTVKALTMVADTGAIVVAEGRFGTQPLGIDPQRPALGMGEPPPK